MEHDTTSIEKRYNFLVNSIEDEQRNEIFGNLARSVEALRSASPFRVVEMALEIHAERMRVVEATKARDAAVHRLLDAYVTVRQQSELIEQLQKEREEHGLEKLSGQAPLESSDLESSNSKARIAELEMLLEDFREINLGLKEYGSFDMKMSCDPPPHYEGEISRSSTAVQTDAPVAREHTPMDFSTNLCDAHPDLCKLLSAKSPDVIALVQARNEMLASIPLPDNAPDMTLSPIALPPQVTLHEFLNAAPASLRTELGNYRVFHSTMTNWCPEREEHGFMYVPMYKCSTNPRAVTAHRWNVVDVIGRMNKPTECFYNNEGTWYYAGSYKAFYLDVISVKEWDQLSSETSAALIKETLAGRKNTTPQNNYETGQLYAAGALKITCVGLQCVGFNLEVYHAVSELATRFMHTKWKASTISVNSSTSTSTSMSPSAGSTSSSVVGTPPISSSSNSTFSGIPSPYGSSSFSLGLGHAAHIHGGQGNNSLSPHPPPSSKIGSPLSPYGYSGPCTPNLPNSGMSTPGLSPIGNSVVGAPAGLGGGGGGLGAGGLGTGSPAWNIASNLKLNPSGALNLSTTSTLGLQLSNINLSPGTAASGIMHHHQHQHYQQLQQQQQHLVAGRSGSVLYEGSENLAPASVVSSGPGVIGSGMMMKVGQ